MVDPGGLIIPFGMTDSGAASLLTRALGKDRSLTYRRPSDTTLMHNLEILQAT